MSKLKAWRVLLPTLFVFLTMLHEVNAMGLFGSKLVLFSEVKGHVLDHGKPLAGVQIERSFTWAWNNDTRTEVVKSSNDGSFYFKPATTTSIPASIIPHQPVIFQTIIIKHDSKRYKAWIMTKMNYDTNGELEGKAINIICDISSEPVQKGDLYGISSLR